MVHGPIHSDLVMSNVSTKIKKSPDLKSSEEWTEVDYLSKDISPLKTALKQNKEGEREHQDIKK